MRPKCRTNEYKLKELSNTPNGLLSFEDDSDIDNENDEDLNDSFLQSCDVEGDPCNSTHVHKGEHSRNSTRVTEDDPVQLNVSFNIADMKYVDDNTLVTLLL